MSVPYYGDFAEDDTVNLPFNTFDSNDPSNSVTATDLVASDIFVHKDGSATAITTDGATIDIDAPGVGAHMITIDTSADADYSTGSEYAVRINGVTVDGGTVNAWVGAFSIERAGGALAVAKTIKAETVLIVADTNELQGDWVDAGRLDAILDLILEDTGELQADDTPTAIAAVQTTADAIEVDTGTTLQAELDAIQAAVITNATGADIAADIIALKAETVLIVADTNELQSDDYPTSIAAIQTTVDAIEVDTGTTLQAELDAIQAAVITNAAGADIAADIIAIKSETATILVDTGTTLQAELDAIQAAVITNAAGADIAADIIALKAETVLIVADTNELQSDDYPTSIAAVQTTVDAIEVDTGTTLQAELDAIQAAVITNAAGADIAADIIAMKAETVLIVADTNELQADDYPTSIAAVQTTVDAIEEDTGTTLDGRIPAALVGGLMSSDVTAIATDTTAPTNLAASALGIVPGICEGSPSTTVIQTDLAEATDDHFIGRVVVFTSGVAAGQASDITDYTGSSGTITITAITTAPAASDTFVVV